MLFVTATNIQKLELVLLATSSTEPAVAYFAHWIGFGTGGLPDYDSSCGNEARQQSDNEEKRIRAMGYILVE